MGKNILISALGASPEIIEETIGLINYSDEYDYYGQRKPSILSHINQTRERAGFAKYRADEIWLVATDKPHSINIKTNKDINSTLEDFGEIKKKCSRYVGKIRIFILKGVSDITTEDKANNFHDLTLRIVSCAQSQLNGGKLYISLACGRKTMSADMQDAAYCFGCDALIHVLGNDASDAFPLLLDTEIQRNEALQWQSQSFYDEEFLPCEPKLDFYEAMKVQKAQTQHFYTTYYLKEDESRSNFHILYTLTPSKIDELKKSKIGQDKSLQVTELDYLRKLPKTDLHCHLGGVLSPDEMIEVAQCYIPKIEEERKTNSKFAKWESSLKSKKIPAQDNWKDWRKKIAEELNVSQGLVVASLLLSYEDHADELKKLIFNDCHNESAYKQIGIIRYESFGDLQGSALLCDENAIRKAVQILLANCKKENVIYLEIRCSPLNYKTEDLSAEQIMHAVLEELEKEKDNVLSSVILIASRHKTDKEVEETIALAQRMRRDNNLFNEYFRGFDLAGDESSKKAKDMRDSFLEIMKDCYNITIHAGEGTDVNSIWEAVYYLNAERIGHGLTLKDNDDLMTKFLERGIGIEMCPSSNFQIVGFSDNYYPETKDLGTYPLKEYLDRELSVSINTDDPGISLTNETKELHKAARLTSDGLSKWEILQLICNGFRTAFLPYKKKQALIRKAEQSIGELIKNNEL